MPARSKPSATVRGEARGLLIESARTLFAEHGYAGTSTREIARSAAVSEPMIFRHFGSKAGLFEEAVLAPFVSFVADYMSEWAARPRGVKSAVDEARDFYRGVYDVLSGNRFLITELIATHRGGSAAGVGDPLALGAVLERFEEVVEHERDTRGFDTFDPAIMTRLMFGLVFSIAIHGDWMFEGATKPRPDVDAFIDQMARMTIFGAYPPPD